MEGNNDEREAAEAPSSPHNDHLFNVVYDPSFDRFFLEDEVLHRAKKQALKRKAVSIPWEKWIVPPKIATRGEQHNRKTTTTSVQLVPSLVVEVDTGAPGIALRPSKQPVPIPTLDFSSFQEPLAGISKAISASPIANRTQAKKKRVRDYTAHFKRANQEVAKSIAKQDVEHEVKWNGEILRVQVPGLRREGASGVLNTNSVGSTSNQFSSNSLQQEITSSPTDEQWRGSIYELKNLMRIRAHADGFRGPAVNSACSFVSVSSSESSESEQDSVTPQQQESEEEIEVMPVFFRDDRVLFHAKHRWFKGTVRRRIPNSDFYDIRADNGSYFEAVLATKIQLLDEEQEEPPYYHFVRGDKVLWTPDSSAMKDLQLNITTTKKTKTSRRQTQRDDAEEPQTYKAKIVQVRSLNRFDLLLRTGRVVKRVLHEQLHPQDVFAYASATTVKRR